MRQYGAQRRRGGHNPLRVGVVAAGTIFYLQDESWWRDRYRGRPVCRNPWIVAAFLNGTVAAGRRNRDPGLWEDVYLSGRSDTAIVRSLRDGRQRQVAVRILILHEDEGLVRHPALYPTLPDMRFWRTGARHAKEIEAKCRTRPRRPPDKTGAPARMTGGGGSTHAATMSA
jgi:hypothetical protein